MDFIKQALIKGATTIVVDELLMHTDLISLCKQYQAELRGVTNPRQALAILAASALHNPADKLHIIGITGTKGKSTTAFIVEHMLRKAGIKTALLSTVQNKILHSTEASKLTTPSADYLQMFFARCVQEGVTHVVMEVSSHALSLDRVHGITFTGVGFTNLAPEHLDFYQDMQSYFDAKAKIFSQSNPNSLVIINGDNEWSSQAYASATSAAAFTQATVQAISQHESHNFKQIIMRILQASCDGIELILENNPPMLIACPQLFGTFNCYNIAMASLLALHAGCSYTDIIKGLASFSGVPGRLQRHVIKNKALAFVDYAHNPSSMQAILQTLRPFTADLIVVFGCGGDRDKTKRPIMGQIACSLANYVIITDDNPRMENNMDIIDQIVAGIPADNQTPVEVIPNRRDAIARAVKRARPDSIIALLGKGHEDYHLVGTERLPFSDFEEICKF
jgi:UDP-N-acetylmuramoyl-L-alanyl-D-glutamate--2,6-diaminopimelate ligase